MSCVYGESEDPPFEEVFAKCSPSLEELLASGDFANFPRVTSRSLTCSRLVDENNLLKPLPKELIEGTVVASEVLDVSNVSQDEEMNFETSEVVLPSPTFSEAAFCPDDLHQRKPRKSREQRISQGGGKVSTRVFHNCTFSKKKISQ